MSVNSLFLIVILICYPLGAGAFPGVYQLELLDFNGKTISKATGFKIAVKGRDGEYRKLILTSFHFLNARLMEAEGIKIGNILGGDSGKAFSILASDELNDLLVLDYKGSLNEDEAVQEDMYLTSECEGNLNVLGYVNEEFHLVSFNSSDVEAVASHRGLFKVPLYLKKGFSGSPILNNKANVCGLVALSSEKNANSIALSSKLIFDIIKSKGLREKGLSIGELRREMSLEFSVTNQTELSGIINSVQETVVLVLDNGFDSGTALIMNAKNLVIKSQRENTVEQVKLKMNNSSNIKLEGFSQANLNMQNCRDITVLY
jgi:hypothetical protein